MHFFNNFFFEKVRKRLGRVKGRLNEEEKKQPFWSGRSTRRRKDALNPPYCKQISELRPENFSIQNYGFAADHQALKH